MSGLSRSYFPLFTGRASLPNQRDPATFPGAAHRDHGRTAGPDQRPNDGTLRRLLREELLRPVCTLREKVLPRVQGRAHGHPEARNHAHQFPGTKMGEYKERDSYK